MSEMKCPRCNSPKSHRLAICDDCFKIANLQEATRQHQEEPKQDFGLTASSVKPRFGLIPYDALISMADRFELGENKYKEKAWNALSDQISLENEAWIISRVEHVIHHAYVYLQKMKGLIPDNGDDDAAGIMWGGSLLHEAKRLRDVAKKHRK